MPQNSAKTSTLLQNRTPQAQALEAQSHPESAIFRPSSKRNRSGFTLTELLVVVTIIAVLASLAVTGAIAALNAAKRARINLEIKEIERSILTVKGTFGSFPPNAMFSDGVSNAREVKRMFDKAFPRHNEPDELIRALAGSDETGKDVFEVNTNDFLLEGMNGAEALYFWLGGFSKDEQYPISGKGGPSYVGSEIVEDRNRLYEFDLTRIGPRNSDGGFSGRTIQYEVDRGSGVETRRINLWHYAPANSEKSYVYFDTSRAKPAAYDPDISGAAGAGIYALKKLREGFDTSNTVKLKDIRFVSEGKFQLLHAGLDDIWGNEFARMAVPQGGDPDDDAPTTILYYPDGPFTGDIADTMTNFATGTLEDAQE